MPSPPPKSPHLHSLLHDGWCPRMIPMDASQWPFIHLDWVLPGIGAAFWPVLIWKLPTGPLQAPTSSNCHWIPKRIGTYQQLGNWSSSQRHILDCFISGLKPEIQNDMAILQPTTISHAIGLAKLTESKLQATQPPPSSIPWPTFPKTFNTQPLTPNQPLLLTPPTHLTFPAPPNPKQSLAIRRLSWNASLSS